MDGKDREAAISKLVPPLTVSEAVDRNAREMGSKEAVGDAHMRLTWQQVKERMDRMAAALMSRGLGREDMVLVQMPNGIDLFTIRLGCEKAGVRMVTAPATFREAELRAIIGHTRPSMAFVPFEYRNVDYVQMVKGIMEGGASLKAIVASGDGSGQGVIPFEEFLSGPSPKDDEVSRNRLGFFDVCEIQTTSGSTGVPKCVDVPISARSLTGYVQSKRYRVQPSDVVVALTPLISGTSNSLAYYTGPRLGVRLFMVSHFNAAEVVELLEREKANIVIGVPTMLAQMVQIPEFSRAHLPNLRAIASHGALLVAELGREVESRTGARILEAYGSADFGGICATSYDDPEEVRLGSLGRPLDGNEVRLVDDEGKDMPKGEAGRILVRGLHAVAGYHRNPELNAQTWASGYFDLQEFGRLDEFGNLSMAGRKKDLIIRGGQNIYPADIEHLLAKHPRVSQVSVVGYPDKEYGEKVCACVVPQPGQTLGFDEMVQFLKAEKIAPFKLPERLEIFDDLPKGASGLMKVDKGALRAIVAAKVGAQK